MMQAIAIWRFLKIISLVGGAFLIIVMPLISGVIQGVKTDDWKPTLDASAGTIFASDQNVKTNVDLIIKSDSYFTAEANTVSGKFLNSLKSEIILNVLILSLWVMIWYFLLCKFLLFVANIPTETGLTMMTKIFVFLSAVFMIALVEFIYSLAVPPHDIIIPFGGIWRLIIHPEIWAKTSVTQVIASIS